ncbi:MAG: FixH family protein [Rhodospirillales bacterium]|jgi:hypothetical protein|nr:FixH family protein [Rhodospirillales bacterium]
MIRFLSSVAVAAGLSLAAAGPALAAAADYVFEAVTKEVQAGYGATIDVRLIHTPSGKPAQNAVIFDSRFDRGPHGRPDIVTYPTPADEVEPGVYRFKVDISEAGRWALLLHAKVPGEPETVQGQMLITAAGR